MPDPSARARISAMTASLQTIEAQLVRGQIGGEGLEDLKRGVDDLRLRIWAIMAAATSGESGAMERFRIRRAIDVCSTIGDEIASGDIDARHPEVAELRVAVQHLLAVLAGGPARPG
jgi:hypothetical protein